MSDQIKLGDESAFPITGNSASVPTYYGMTKREYFAAAALTGLCANPDVYGTKLHNGFDLEAAAIASADATLARLGENE